MSTQPPVPNKDSDVPLVGYGQPPQPGGYLQLPTGPGYPPPEATGPGGHPQTQPGYSQPGTYSQPPITSQPGYEQQAMQQPGSGQAIPLMVQQPESWMQLPTATLPNCPAGLEYLTVVDQLLVHQKVEMLEAFTGIETANKYTVKNSMGQKVFYAMEESEICTRNILGTLRPFEMKILDNGSREVIHITRPFRCTFCCFPCFLQELDVCAPAGEKIGSIEQVWSICMPKFIVKDAAGETILRIELPCSCSCSCSCMCQDVEFSVLSLDGLTEVGKITKQWTGFARETYTDATNFSVSFPMDLDVRAKATLLAATFLIDFMFFEKSGK